MPETVHKRIIRERISWLNELSSEHSRLYRSPEAYLNRARYQARHPTYLIAFKCMDGRLHLPYITKTPLGIIEPFRNLGGAFDLGWPYLGEIVAASVLRAVNKGQRVLILATYHFSKGDPKRCCAGFDHDTGKALHAMLQFKAQIESVFGADQQTVNIVVVGVETDEDALVFHGSKDETMNLADVSPEDDRENALRLRVSHRLEQIYPEMHQAALADLVPLALGNIRHIAEVRRTVRTLDIEHHEWVLCVGRGFDFLHVPNTALIVGPYSPNMDVPIVTAARLIQSNMEEGRIPDDGFVLLASSPYNDIGVDQRRAVEKARFMSRFSAETIAREVPYVHERMFRRTCVLNWSTRELTEIDVA